MAEFTYSYARANLAKVMERLVADRGVAVITRRGHADVAMIAADELASLQETAYLFRSPANAARLLKALGDSLALKIPPGTAARLDRINNALKKHGKPVGARAKRK